MQSDALPTHQLPPTSTSTSSVKVWLHFSHRRQILCWIVYECGTQVLLGICLWGMWVSELHRKAASRTFRHLCRAKTGRQATKRIFFL